MLKVRTFLGPNLGHTKIHTCLFLLLSGDRLDGLVVKHVVNPALNASQVPDRRFPMVSKVGRNGFCPSTVSSRVAANEEYKINRLWFRFQQSPQL